jgi:tetratricopeptide (TPR) repeat protein
VTPGEKPPTLLDVALLSAERWAIARMRGENDNLTWQSGQLTALTRLLARAGRYDDALALVRTLDTPERVKVEAYAPIVAAYLRNGDKARAAALTEKVTGIEAWTTSGTLAEVARAMDAAGDRAGALKLAASIPGGHDRAEVLFGMHRYTEALAAAREIAPDTFHVDCGEPGTHCWVEDWDPRQSYIVKLVKAFVDEGDLRGAHAALAALDEVKGFNGDEWKAKALVEIARREEPVATLQQALVELDRAPIMIPGDYRDHAETLADIATGLAAAGQRTQAVGLMPRAMAALGSTDSVDSMEIAASIGIEGLVHIAGAQFEIGQRDEALALLARAERLVNEIVVPPQKESAGSSWDSTASTQQDRVEGKMRIAATLEAAGEVERAEKVLASARTELASIKSSEWREYSWRSLVEAYSEAGKLDRAMELLTSGLRGDSDRWLAISQMSDEELLGAPRTQLWGLLDALPADWSKASLASRLAIRLDALGEQTSVSRLVTESLTAVAAMAAKGPPDWQLTLVELGGTLPGADRPGNAEQQRLLRHLLAAVQAQPVAAPKLSKTKG